MIDTNNITGIILAGGKSSRMGTDKGFIPWKGKRFINYIIDALKPLIKDLCIVSDHTHYDVLGYKRVQDIYTNAGPLSGLYSGLLQSKTHLNIVLSCDVPCITTEVLQKLLDVYQQGTAAVVCKTDKKVMPLVALYDKDCSSICRELLDNDKRRMMYLLESLDNVKYLVLGKDQEKQIKNMNTLCDLNEIYETN